jgi:hypothetical protein
MSWRIHWTSGGGGNTDAYLSTSGIRTLYGDVGTSYLLQVGGVVAAAIGSGYVGVGPVADQPATGSVRLPLAGTIKTKFASGSDGTLLTTSGSSGNTDAWLGELALRHLYLRTGTDIVCYAGSGTTLTIGDGYLGVGSSALPTAGELRFSGASWSIYALTSGSADARIAWWQNSTGSLEFGNSTNVIYAYLKALTAVSIEAGTGISLIAASAQIVGVDVGGLTVASGKELDITGATVRTSTGSQERNFRGVTASDAGEDGSPIAILTYTVPEGKVVTVKCWARGERDDNTPGVLYDSQWTLKLDRPEGGAAVEYSAAVVPSDNADPVTADMEVTYALASSVLTIYKQNDSGTAMRWVARIVVDEDDVEGDWS